MQKRYIAIEGSIRPGFLLISTVSTVEIKFPAIDEIVANYTKVVFNENS
jgi:hypothetical protein